MARLRPARLNLRTQSVGGEVRDRPCANPATVLTGQWHLILLIHGYNNDESAAREAYDGFRAVQRELGDLSPDQPVADGRLVDVYWPGDADWGIASPLYYMWSIGKAQATAAKLADAIKRAVDQSGFKQIDIVAHSMGSRLTLELLKGLMPQANLHVRRVVFMAGAVPTFMLDTDGALRPAYDFARLEGALSLFSPADMVLGLAFPLGQTLGGAGEGWFPTALGHEAWLESGVSVAFSQQEIVRAGHSDYWGWNPATREQQGRSANSYVREFLGLTAVGSRGIRSRAVTEREPAEERLLSPDREIPRREAGESDSGACVEI